MTHTPGSGSRWLREPVLHFFLLGLALFLLHGWFNGRGALLAERVVITQGRVQQLASGFAAIHQRTPTSDEVHGMVDDAVREEIYYREAKSMGLDQDDTIVRRRLTQKLEFVSEDISAIAEPTDSQLNDYLQSHREQFPLEHTFDFTQIYLSPERRGERLEADARSLLARLPPKTATPEVSNFGDVFLLDSKFQQISASELARLFGADFEVALRSLPIGQWSGPVRSAYGAHLVWIETRHVEKAAALNDVRDDVRRAWIHAQRVAANDRFYADLRKRYDVVVELPASWDAPDGANAAALASPPPAGTKP